MSLIQTWQSNFGNLKIIQNGDRIHGLYRDLGVIEAIKEKGTNRFLGTFTNTGKQGRMRFAINANSSAFAGTWNWGDHEPSIPSWDNVLSSNEWEGENKSRKIETATKVGDPWEGTWESTYGTLHLHQNGTRLYGLYRDLGIIEGERVGTSRQVKGRFTNTGREGWFSFEFAPDGKSFSGKYGWTPGNKEGDWSGDLLSATAEEENNRFKIENIEIPYAPGRTDLRIEVQAQGNPSSRPTVILHVSRTESDLESNPIELKDLRSLGGKSRFSAELPVSKPGHPSRHELVCGQRVYAKAIINTGRRVTDTRTFEFDLPDPVVLVNIGDSYGAGVGTGRYDLDANAKRSSNSGQHRAMEEFSSLTPSVIINVSRSGNKLNPHIIKNDGSEGNQLKDVENQLDNLVNRGVLSTKHVDYLIVSAGGNDMHEDGLSGLIKRLLISIWNPFNNPFFKNLRNDIQANLTNLKRNLDRFHRFIQFNSIYKDTKVIYCTYPDSTRDEHGKHTKAPSILLPSINRVVTSLSDKDFEFAYEYMIKDINERIKGFCSLDRTRYFQNDVEPVSRNHGYPSNHSYFVRLRMIEGELMFDAFHPTPEGYARIYLDTIEPLLKPLTKPARYQGGDGSFVSHQPI